MARPGTFEQLVLFAVLQLDDRAYGAAVRRQIGLRTGRTPAAGAVYTTLKRLETGGLLESTLEPEPPARGGRRRRCYRVRPAGLRSLHRAYRELTRMAGCWGPGLSALVDREERPD